MADYTDGSSFVGIDADAVSADQPLDTWLDHRLWSNTSYLSIGRDSCTATFLTHGAAALNTSTGHRPFAGMGDWQTVLIHRMPLTRGLLQVNIDGVYNVQSEGATQSDVDVKITIQTDASTVIGELITTLANTDNAGSPSFEDFSKTITLTAGTWNADTTWAYLIVWIRSQDGGANADITTSGWAPYQAAGFITASNGDLVKINGPAAGSLEVAYLRNSDGDAGIMDLWAVDYNGASAEIAYTNPPNNQYNTLTTETFTARYCSYLQLRSIGIKPIYLASSISPIQQADLSAQIAIRGRTEAQHAQSLRAVRARPRLVGFGPTGIVQDVDAGYERDADTWPNDYAEWWAWTSGDDTNAVLVDALIYPDGENPIIEIDLLLIAVGMGASPAALTPFSPGLIPEPGITQWQIDASVSQVQDGSTTWTSYGSYTETGVQFPTYGTGITTSFPFLYTQQMLYQFGDVANASTGGYDSLAFAFKEGSLFSPDLALIETYPITLELSGYDTEQAWPARLKVETSFDSVEKAIQGYQSGDDIYRVVCVGWSAWQRAAVNG